MMSFSTESLDMHLCTTLQSHFAKGMRSASNPLPIIIVSSTASMTLLEVSSATTI